MEKSLALTLEFYLTLRPISLLNPFSSETFDAGSTKLGQISALANWVLEVQNRDPQ